MKNEIKHTTHSTYRCQYHIVFAPKYRRKAIYGQLKADTQKAVRTKRSRNNRGNSNDRSYAYAGKHSAVFKYSTIHGISQGEKYTNDIRQTRKFEV